MRFKVDGSPLELEIFTTRADTVFGVTFMGIRLPDRGLMAYDPVNTPVTFLSIMRSRVSAYAGRLLDGLDSLDWTDSLKETQRNWIGRSPLLASKLSLLTSAPSIRGMTGRSKWRAKA